MQRHLGPHCVRTRAVLVLGLIAAFVPCFAAIGETARPEGKKRRTTTATSANFAIRSYPSGPTAAGMTGACEKLRREIQLLWLGKMADSNWCPRCQIVLHATKTSYLRAVGRNGGQTSGSSLIKQQQGRIVDRRIDLLVDRCGHTSALRHELTHVVIADQFLGERPPPWLDEGIATLADSSEKVSRHQEDCRAAIHNGTAFHLFELLTLDRLSSPAQFPAFYGQSVCLTKFLLEQDEPTKLIPFAKCAARKGYDEALKSHYDIDGVGGLQRAWRGYVLDGPRSANFQFVGHQPSIPNVVP